MTVRQREMGREFTEIGERHKYRQTIKAKSFVEVIRLLQLFHLPADIFRTCQNR